jgi:hypothetical protein
MKWEKHKPQIWQAYVGPWRIRAGKLIFAGGRWWWEVSRVRRDGLTEGIANGWCKTLRRAKEIGERTARDYEAEQ